MVDESAESQARPPGLTKIFHIHTVITSGVSLAPSQQLLKAADGVFKDKHSLERGSVSVQRSLVMCKPDTTELMLLDADSHSQRLETEEQRTCFLFSSPWRM